MEIKGESIVVKTGQRWVEKGSHESAPTWKVVSLSSEGIVGLTGPGPCRSMKYVYVDELENDWDLVEGNP